MKVFAYAVIVAGVATTSCSGSRPLEVLPPAPPTHPLIVNHPGGSPDAFYDPTPIKVKVGQTIAWTNKDHEPHDVTSFSAGFSSGPVAYGGTYRWVPTRPGTYHYFCTLHPDMHGVVIVR